MLSIFSTAFVWWDATLENLRIVKLQEHLWLIAQTESLRVYKVNEF